MTAGDALQMFLVAPFLFLGGVAEQDQGSEDSLAVRSTQRIDLPLPRRTGSVSLEEVLQRRRSVREYRQEELLLVELGQLLWAAQGVTDSLGGGRTAPSAGALYPLQIRVLAGEVEGVNPGLYRYNVAGHFLVLELQSDLRTPLAEAALGQKPIRLAPCVLLITGIVARTAIKYGPRAERYVQMEAGHAGENIYLQATALGLGTVSIGAFDDQRVSELLRLVPGERPLYIMPVGRPKETQHD